MLSTRGLFQTPLKRTSASPRNDKECPPKRPNAKYCDYHQNSQTSREAIVQGSGQISSNPSARSKAATYLTGVDNGSCKVD